MSESSRATQRSQSLVEFALVAPVLLLLVFGIIDLGRAVYAYATITGAANEAIRYASAGQPPAFAVTDDAGVLAVAKGAAPAIILQFGPCPNGPVSSTTPPGQTGYLYITAGGGGPGNAPGGEPAAGASGSCAAVLPASGHVPLMATIKYTFVPSTPFASLVKFTMTATATRTTEY